jgi:hypothetical protein
MAAPSTTPAVTTPLTAAQKKFVIQARGKYAAAVTGNTAAQIAEFETTACQYLAENSGTATVSTAAYQEQQNWTWQGSPPSQAIIMKLVVLAAHDGCKATLVSAERVGAKIARKLAAARLDAKQDAAAAARHEARQDAAQTAARRLAHTVTYIVTGSPADVTYGPSGSDLQGYVPMDVNAPLGNPVYYAISAQLQGGGQVTCEILVGGKVISKSTATGSYNIATCEISQDPVYGGWVNTNG